jgi:hypothetical protein
MIDIKRQPKEKVLAALYNASRVQGMGYLQAKAGQMDEAQAKKELEENPGCYFDYLHGKVMKVDLSKDQFDPWLYDRDNGQGAAERALKPLLS